MTDVSISAELAEALDEWRQAKTAFHRRPPGAGPALAFLERIAEIEGRMLTLIAEQSRAITSQEPSK